MQVTVALLSVAVAVASAPGKPASPAAAQSPQPAYSPQPLSKYERAHLTEMKISAPADEYFGRLKLSFLGIDNTLRDTAKTAGDDTTDAGIITKVALADDALADWERKYPHDPQLARSYYFAIQVNKKIWLQPNQQLAWVFMNRIVSEFPNTYFGKLVKREIAIGFTEHYYSEPVPCATATPSPTPSPEPTVAPPLATATPARANRRQPRATPTPVPTPRPTPVPTATPSPEPTPTPAPEIRQLGKGLKVQVLTPPCAAAPRPSPIPSEAPPSATPEASSSPAPSPAPRRPS